MKCIIKINNYLQCSSISGTDLVLLSSRHNEPSSSLSENSDNCGWWDDTKKVVHSCRIKTGFEQLAGEAALVTADPTKRLAVSSWALITCCCLSQENKPFRPDEQKQRK